MKNLFNILLINVTTFFILCLISSCDDHLIDSRFHKKTFSDSTEKLLPYRFFIPDSIDYLAKYPLVIFLHGGTGAGTNNINQISGENWNGSHCWIQTKIQTNFPTFVLAPQLPNFQRWNSPLSDSLTIFTKMTLELIDSLIESYPIDRNRIYLTGQSLGGWGVWFLITKKPDLFAAAIPICGGGNPEDAINATDVSIWAFHGFFDEKVNVARSREMLSAFEDVGANIKYSEFICSGHEIWNDVYRDEEVINWL